MVVVAAGGDESRAGFDPKHELESEDAAVETQGSLKVGDLQVDMPDPDFGMEVADGGGRAHGGSLGRPSLFFNSAGALGVFGRQFWAGAGLSGGTSRQDP